MILSVRHVVPALPPGGKPGADLTLNLLTTTIVAPPSNASKWQVGFNSAFKGMHEKPTNIPIIHSVVVSSDVVRSAHHVTRHNTPIHNILSTAPQLSISQKALGTLPEDGNVMPKHIGATIHNS